MCIRKNCIHFRYYIYRNETKNANDYFTKWTSRLLIINNPEIVVGRDFVPSHNRERNVYSWRHSSKDTNIIGLRCDYDLASQNIHVVYATFNVQCQLQTTVWEIFHNNFIRFKRTLPKKKLPKEKFFKNVCYYRWLVGRWFELRTFVFVSQVARPTSCLSH